ncbi:MAG: helix-turn-helix domain-containing protein [Deltaproteobacteria bacterium]|nr:helix-turn-helix domain-containing protein [Deltaproteobacteria bacterium]
MAPPPTRAEGEGKRQTSKSIHRPEVPDYSGLLEPILPVLEASQVQLRPGPPPSTATIFSSDKVAAIRIRHHVQSVGVIILKPEYAAYVNWVGTPDGRINGVAARPNVLHSQGAQDGFHARGGPRRSLGIVVRRDELIDTLAALRGVGPEDVSLNRSTLELSPQDATRFQTSLIGLLTNAAKPGSGGSPHARSPDVGEAIFGLLVDAELHAQPELKRRGWRRPQEQIVRQAEERYFAAQGARVSLADLCAAARVSQAALYRAFHHVCGEAPLAYFQKRRLTSAQRQLVLSLPERGAVKRAALDVGLTELGRFSAEYRRLFGEPPSATLSKVPKL